ncbi:MAG: D-alanyl-D-alanine carboxypeptidase [Oscillospiraceae bacterium]|jgi:D-alanyl-D-alanine carboxypeptidase (penicillin-binding protein 5/6)|nr:D-alanyl-D-alanine carboxypeptidase [Oscillospiraceae bacterium]
MFSKKLASIILTVILLLSPLSIININAVTQSEISAPSAVLIEVTTGKVLYEKNPHEVRPAASLTKIMSALLVLEAVKNGKIAFDTDVTVSAKAAAVPGADVFLVEGEVMSVSDMLKATMVASANDATLALAETLAGSETAFVEKMNTRAKELGMNDTVFKNCNGEEEGGHVTSAFDVAVMSAELLKHEKIIEYSSIWLDTLRGGKTQIVNSNKLLKSYSGITGLKTGTTEEAGSCISASAVKNDMAVCAVVLGCQSGTERFKDATTLLDFGFANYKMANLALPTEGIEELKVSNGMTPTIELECDVNKKVVLSNENSKKITPIIELPESFAAPISPGEQVGVLKYLMEGEMIAQFPIRAKTGSEEMTYKSILDVLLYWLFAF